MAFALTKFKADGIRHTGANRSHGEQVAIFNITAANTDTDLDISDDGGTFWTAALANATYGTIAAEAYAMLFGNSTYGSLTGAVANIVSVEGDPLVSYQKVLTLTAGNEYTVAVNSDLPDLAFNSGSAPTALVLQVRWILKDTKEPVFADLGAQLT